MAAILNFSWIERPTDSKLDRKYRWNLSWPFTLEPKGQLIRNFIGSIEVTYRSKLSKIFLIGNPRWPLSGKSVLNFFSWTEKRPDDSILFDNQVTDTGPSWSSFRRSMFTFTTLWANSADDNLVIFFLLFPVNWIWHCMQIANIGGNLHEMEAICMKCQNCFLGIILKYFNMSSAENFTQSAKR